VNLRRDAQAATITIRLKPTSHLAGHVRNSAGKPVAGQTVEVWSRGGDFLPPNPVGFKNGPLLSALDGAFRTPDNLLVGSQYRLVVRAPGFEPILSQWITAGEQPRVLLPMIQRPLRTLSGGVVDRQGKPLAGIEVFQSGDGPERTATKTDGDGRFGLGGFRQGAVFLFARGDGFRFFGHLVKPGEGGITVELTRTSERPTREMRMLPEPIPLEESRALARRLIEPCWEAAVAKKNENAAYQSLRFLAAADPNGVLEKLEKAEEVLTPVMASGVKYMVARNLARSDPAQALQLGETIESPQGRYGLLLLVADALPAEKRDQKLALIARAAVEARAAKIAFATADVAERLYELGEKNMAKTLFAESVLVKPDPSAGIRGRFAARLARFDLPAALAIAKERTDFGPEIYWNIALRVAAENPAEAERVLRLVPQEPGKRWLPPSIAWRMAQADPARARRLVDEAQRYDDNPQTYLFLALGLKARNPAAADEAFWKAIQGIDRLMKEGAEYSSVQGIRGVLLPLVEQIDPALVPELFWRAVATRPPIGNPHWVFDDSPSNLVLLLGWYDREVAAALFEPVRALLDKTDNGELAGFSRPLLGWSFFDPRAAAARLEQVPSDTGLPTGAKDARQGVGEILGLSFEDRWRRVWTDSTDMRLLLERDIR